MITKQTQHACWACCLFLLLGLFALPTAQATSNNFNFSSASDADIMTVDLHCPNNITVTAPSGGNGKTVSWNTPTATTNCTMMTGDCDDIPNNFPNLFAIGERNNHKYFCSTNNDYNWSAAQNLAASVNNGYLAVINGSQENEFIRSHIQASTAWIGYSDAANEGIWRWVNGSTHSYTNWDSGEPNNVNNSDYAVILQGSGKWRDREGSDHYEVVVEVPCGTTQPGSVSIQQTQGPASGSFFNIGTTTIRYTATDDCGNTETCTFTVTVNPPADPCDNAGGDADNDGVCADDDCDDNDASVGAQQAPGTACNDGNPNTNNDVIQSDGCTCAGTPTGGNDCDDVAITTSAGKITVDGLDAPIVIVKIFNSSWQTVFECSNNCNMMEMVSGLNPGQYCVQIKYFNASWSLECDRLECVSVPGGGNPCDNAGGDADNDGVCADDDCDDNDASIGAQQTPGTACNDGNPNTNNDVIQSDGCTCAGTPINGCDNVTNGGQIGYDESICGAYDPTMIVNVTSPSGGSGAIEYIWLKSTSGCPTSINQQIPGATGATYNPPTITQTTWYVRCSRRAGCNDWFVGESNCVKKEVKTTGCNDVCETRTVTNSKTSCGSGIAYGFYAVNFINGMNANPRYTIQNTSFEEFPDLTATFTGTAVNISNSNVRFNFSVDLSGRTFSTPSGSPQASNCYNVNTADWYYYTSLDGTLTGTNGMSGAVIQISLDNKAFQVGTGANLNDQNIFGASTWLDYTIVSHPNASGVSFNNNRQMDFNIRLSGENLDCPDAPGGGSNITLSCPNNINVTQNQNGGRVVTWNMPTASTDCNSGGATIQQTEGFANGAVFPVGTTTVSFTATDPCGSQATCSFVVTVHPDNSGNPPTGYCTNWADIPWHEWIARVEFGSIDNASSKIGYEDYTNLSTDVARGSTHPITLTPGFSWTQYNEYWTVWIDYNRDGDFEDAGEQALQGNSSSTLIGSIHIPSSAASGPTRMRIVMQRNSYATSACGGIGEGEVEDYIVNITDSFADNGETNFSSSHTNNRAIFYPNPAQQRVHVDLKAFEGEMVEIIFMDAMGRMTFRKTIAEVPTHPMSISLTSLPMGIYTVYIKTQNTYQVDKLLITKR